ncbi:hypothetical protein CAOG_007189 [Capsaspora owczarzaki ATCC 30864]|uniref:Ubiquitin-like domain-containing protein n=2 Tax=Capsaspora owczarzaki (strain ATCC 30864) TaxID=595528 RepID=A0A0D2WVP8_CAPO3|nr:hypothetical protein CAOG_007189 [Capsaspora owczarzaki ATCC 30864]
MYIRIKRKKLTVFLECSLSDTVGVLKQKLGRIVQMEPANMRLLFDQQVLDDSKTVELNRLANDDQVVLVYKQADGEWEAPDVTPTDTANLDAKLDDE